MAEQHEARQIENRPFFETAIRFNVEKPMLNIFITILGALFILLGLIGGILPVLPGPSLSFIGLLLLALIQQFSPPLTSTLIIVMAIVTIAVTLIDYVVPVWGAKTYGTSKWGIWGSVAGMAIGIFFPPFGILLGALIGAMVVELLIHKEKGQALKAGWGVFAGTLLGMVLKLGTSGVMAYYFVLALFEG